MLHWRQLKRALSKVGANMVETATHNIKFRNRAGVRLMLHLHCEVFPIQANASKVVKSILIHENGV